MDVNSKIYIAGHNGMVGSAILRQLKTAGYNNIITRTHSELNLTCQADTDKFFNNEKPDYVFMSAALVGGIFANMNNQARYLLENLQIECNVINSAYKHEVKKLLFLGSSCIYPKNAEQPISEKSLLTGLLEPTNEGYAIAKIAGLKLCEYYNKQNGAAFVSAMPCNLYGYNDNFELNSSHMFPALVRKFHEAKVNNSKSVTVWGTGKVYRELLFVDDLAKALIFIMDNYSEPDFLNVGYGNDYTISEIAGMIKEVVGCKSEIIYDNTKPDGMYRKIVDSRKIRELGWKPEYDLIEGIKLTYDWYVRNEESLIRR